MCASVDHTEGTFDPEVDRVPAGHSVASGVGPAPIPSPPRGSEEDPRGSRRDSRDSNQQPWVQHDVETYVKVDTLG